jgi:hypothetical protein
MLEFEITKDHLIFKVTNPDEYNDYIETHQDKSPNEIFEMLIDDCGFIGNGLQFVAPEEIGALTDSFIFVDNDENYYWNPNYQLQ